MELNSEIVNALSEISASAQKAENEARKLMELIEQECRDREEKMGIMERKIQELEIAIGQLKRGYDRDF